MLKYLISNEFNYSKLISRDTGPFYAQDMGWETEKINNAEIKNQNIYIIDNRITPQECLKIQATITKNKHTRFFFTLIDPYVEWQKENYYTKTILKMKNSTNVFFLSKYGPKEIVKELDDLTCNKKMAVLPYPFKANLSVPIDLKNRQKKIFISGNMHKKIYPLRYQLLLHKKWNPFLQSKLVYLKHPGYADIGEKQKHSIVGDNFITYCSHFIFMLCCPSRCDLEFLKYSECAYAGCVPVGRAPSTFDKDLRDCVLELDTKNLFKSISGIFKISLNELEDRARVFRDLMEKKRNPAALHKKFLEMLDSF